jgi:hypothetical protein
VTINTYAVKTVLLALTAAVSFAAAIVVGFGAKNPDVRQAVSCDTTTVVAASPRRPSSTC